MFWFIGLLWVRKKVSALGSRDQHPFSSSSGSLAPGTYSSKHILFKTLFLSDYKFISIA